MLPGTIWGMSSSDDAVATEATGSQILAGELSSEDLNHDIVVHVPVDAAFPCRVQGELVGIHHALSARTRKPVVVVAIGGPCLDSPWGPEWRPFVLHPDWNVTVTP